MLAMESHHVPNDPPAPRLFSMIRQADETGISGVGRVLDGVVFPDGQTVIRWCVTDKPASTEIYDTFEAFLAIHVESHPTNQTEIVWLTAIAATGSGG
jgi:hypothetical protein